MEHVANLTLPATRTWSELTSEPFLLDFAHEVGVDVHDLQCTTDGPRALASMDWTFETDRPGIPALARKFLPTDVRLRWSQEWSPLTDGSATGRLDVELHGRPSATSTGDCLLVADGSGSTLSTATNTQADLPFPVRKTTEKLIDSELVGWILSVQERVLVRRNPA